MRINMGLMNKVFGNTRKPEGFIGKMMAKGMNSGSHSALADWGFQHIQLQGNEKALDAGCGGGANLKRFTEKLPDGCVVGLDYSDVSVDTSKKTNKKAIEDGKCIVVCGNVMEMPFDDEAFDIVTAFETIYFWPDPAVSFGEVYRVLRTGGKFMITNESNGRDESSIKWSKIVEGMRLYTAEQLTLLLTEAGFVNIICDEDEAKHRLCVVAEKN